MAILFSILLAIVPPTPTRYVTDAAGVLQPARAEALNQKLADFERDTSDQVLVYVDRDLPAGVSIEQFATAAMDDWHVGQARSNNGVILLVFTKAHQMRIQVGSGLRSTLTDAHAHDITSQIIKPPLRAGQFDTAVEAGATAVMDSVRGLPFRGNGATVAESRTAYEPDTSSNADLWIFVAIAACVVTFNLIKSKLEDRFAGGARVNDDSPAYYSTMPDPPDTPFDSSAAFDNTSYDAPPSNDFAGGGGTSDGSGGASDSW